MAFRGRRLETATVSEDQGGFVRVLNPGHGWGIASFTSLDELPAMVKRANELSNAVRLDEPIRLADAAAQTADAGEEEIARPLQRRHAGGVERDR